MTPADVAIVGSGCMIAGFVLDRFVHPGRRVSKRLEEFFEDWNGKPERRSADGTKILEARKPGVVETLNVHTEDIAEIKSQLNGGGLGSKMTALEGRVVEHIESADVARDELSNDIQAVKEQVGEIQRFSFRLAQGQERLETAVQDVQEKVDGRLFELEESERGLRAVAHELGLPLDLPEE